MTRGPKLAALIFTAIVAVFLLVSRSGGTRYDALNMTLLHLEDGYILYFQPDPKYTGPEASVETLSKFADEYTSIVERMLDGLVLQKFDTLMYGFSFRLEHTKKVQEAIGSESVPQDVVGTTDDRLFRYLNLLKAKDMTRYGVMMKLERDKTLNTQGEAGSA
ncbi:hypothetical protein METBIDRAFT_41378 [Metschnikowia bicuspidata var. bicuspidata NRRL YB-4993]|uniref:Uncharacterized protein n=1 Tax=Metschnikowia bicuspidata var. bicuspidata NRRL YB-4993 TaxID=869754 RepID=A0A1A0HAB0_9ASCO|nr:hypothetical protein METBIDRAFT_41378 [Metschnikowia bicuspidata var. bicuspidata NRRL YB-4993]OBA20940.1 hypothetical protein METBIDRAFT_41378 [Metschnikowia bicuspidata var. bicuspidata NRRL YB-4993]